MASIKRWVCLTAAAEQGDWTVGPREERYVLRVSPLWSDCGWIPSRVATDWSSGAGRQGREGREGGGEGGVKGNRANTRRHTYALGNYQIQMTSRSAALLNT